MSKTPTLSAYILTTNNEDTIKTCLDSLKGVDEVLVVDGGSTDRTLEIARQYKNVRIYRNPWPGYAKQRNFALSKVKTDWVLLVDSDMEAPPELIKEIKETIKKPKYNAYYISYYNFFLSYPLFGGDWFPSYTPMLFKVDSSLRYDERRLVHEGGPYKGEYGYLKNFIIHHSYPTVNSWIYKMIKYTDLDSEKMKEFKKIFGRYNVKMNVRNPFSVMKFLLWYPFIYFMWVMFWKKGYRGKIPGLVYAILGSFYIFITHVKYWDYECAVKGVKPKIKDSIALGFRVKHRYLKK